MLGEPEANILWQKEPPPIKNDHPAVWDLVIADVQKSEIPNPNQKMVAGLFIEDVRKRDFTGEKKYGVRLQPFNGRNAVKDAYEEMLDGTVYLRQALFEFDHDNNHKIITRETEIIRVGLIQAYMTTLDNAMKLRYILYLQDQQKASEQSGSILIQG